MITSIRRKEANPVKTAAKRMLTDVPLILALIMMTQLLTEAGNDVVLHAEAVKTMTILLTHKATTSVTTQSRVPIQVECLRKRIAKNALKRNVIQEVNFREILRLRKRVREIKPAAEYTMLKIKEEQRQKLRAVLGASSAPA